MSACARDMRVAMGRFPLRQPCVVRGVGRNPFGPGIRAVVLCRKPGSRRRVGGEIDLLAVHGRWLIRVDLLSP